MNTAPRITWLMEFSPEKRVKIVAWGEIDSEMIEAMEAYIARQKARNTALPTDTGSVT